MYKFCITTVKVDLTGFESFWNYIVKEVEIDIDKTKTELDDHTANKCAPSLPPVDGSVTGVDCTGCVCSYRNKRVDDTRMDIEEKLTMAKAEADLIFSKDITKEIDNLYSLTITPWITSTSCVNSVSSVGPVRKKSCL